MELRAWRIIVPLPRPLQFILTILKKKELQHLFHQIFTNFPNTEGICNAVACESHQRTRPLLAILNFSMWSTSVFTTGEGEKKERAESEALKLAETTPSGIPCCNGRWTCRSRCSNGKASEWNKAAASGLRGPSCAYRLIFYFCNVIFFPTKLLVFLD